MSGEIQNLLPQPPQPIAFGKYTLLERISHGGMAEVFRARTEGSAGFERVVAIKLLLPQVANDSDFVTMLIDEAKIAGQLNHANIAQIFDLGQVEGRYYIVQEYVSGRDLRAILRHLEEQHTRLGVPLSCHVVLKVCEALDYAHNKRDAAGQPLNLVHRDISPQNVIVSHEGEVKLIDFGIVKAEGRATRTLAGLVKGKFAYMSPEQIRGLPVDRRSDVFALGIILHELLTGQPLFKRGSEFETLQRARSGDIIPPSALNPDVPPELDRIALRALARHVDDRYQAAIALHDELWEFVRASGNFHSRDQLAAWMRETFGDPGDELDPGLPAAPAPAIDAFDQPGPALPAMPLFGEEDVDSMTVVDSELVARLRETAEEADTVAAEADEALVALVNAQRQRQGEEAPALRDLAEAAQSQPERAVVGTGDHARLAVGSDPSLDLGHLPDGAALAGDGDADAGRAPNGFDLPAVHGPHDGDAGHVETGEHAGDRDREEEEETTSARPEQPRRTKPGPGSPSGWVEPQTPTRRRMPAAEGEESVADLSGEIDLLDQPVSHHPMIDLALDLSDEESATRDAAASDSASTSPFVAVHPSEAGLPSPPGIAPAAGLPPRGMPPVPVAGPDARTLGPALEIPAPFPPPLPGAGYPPVYHLPSAVFPPPSEFGPHSGPPAMGPDPRLAPPLPGQNRLPSVPPHRMGPGPMLPPPPLGYGLLPPGLEPGPAFPGDLMPDLRPASGRYLVVAAIAILVAAVTVSIVLAVTGA